MIQKLEVQSPFNVRSHEFVSFYSLQLFFSFLFKFKHVIGIQTSNHVLTKRRIKRRIMDDPLNSN